MIFFSRCWIMSLEPPNGFTLFAHSIRRRMGGASLGGSWDAFSHALLDAALPAWEKLTLREKQARESLFWTWNSERCCFTFLLLVTVSLVTLLEKWYLFSVSKPTYQCLITFRRKYTHENHRVWAILANLFGGNMTRNCFKRKRSF